MTLPRVPAAVLLLCGGVCLSVPGVTIYFSDFKRSLVDKLQKVRETITRDLSLSLSVSHPIGQGLAAGFTESL